MTQHSSLLTLTVTDQTTPVILSVWLQETECQSRPDTLFTGRAADDLWEEEDDKLDKLKSMLHVGRKGSMIDIIVTTCNEDIARKVSTSKPYKLQPLKDDTCWEIIKRCSHNIAEDDLIHQWVALDFINPSKGKEYIRQLLGMSFIQVSKLPKLPYLESLSLWNLPGVAKIDRGICGGKGSFPRLEKFKLGRMEGLEEFMFPMLESIQCSWLSEVEVETMPTKVPSVQNRSERPSYIFIGGGTSTSQQPSLELQSNHQPNHTQRMPQYQTVSPLPCSPGVGIHQLSKSEELAGGHTAALLPSVARIG
ncbi:hypothetical protein C2845_PM17G14850 [Panicum miliaceum]|uniref:NB-ARC domain-containing protein n=1 Tax=Panicum miliaceum TaxID=4540 RepID=A0A3L6Q408_PANMI|nr:hypothetical protein C2845_PM17G14850 [Panicum miliaceum]